MYRGVDALALSVSRDLGRMADAAKGSGFLLVKNNDQTAERMGQFLVGAGIDSWDVIPWNASRGS